MRSMLFSTALIFAAMATTGCVSLSVDKGCDTGGAVGCSDCSDCGSGVRLGGLLGRLRGEGACSTCGDGASGNGSSGSAVAMPGGIGSQLGMGGGAMMGAGARMGGGAMMGRGARMGGGGGRLAGGMLAGGFGKCTSCGLLGGRCGCNENAAPYTPHPYQGAGQGGPQMGTYAYPYYTTRAPRDFLMANPPSIGR